MKLTDLLQLSISGLAALENASTKQVYIIYSTDILALVSRLIRRLNDKDMQALKADVEQLELVILENRNVPMRELRARYNYWLDLYKAKGYTSYRSYEGSRLRVAVRLDKLDGEIVHVVELISRRYSRIVVGVFSSAQEADTFVERTYRDMKHIFPVYNESALRTRYIQVYGQ